MNHFDERVNRDNTGSGKWNEIKALTDSVIYTPLTTADMEFKTCDKITNALMRRIEHGVFGYTKPDERLFATVSSFLKRKHGLTVERSMLVYTTSVVPAIHAGIKAVTEEGEGVIVFSPVYTAFFSAIKITNRQLVDCPLLIKDGRYEIDFSLFEQLAKEQKNKMLIFCNPHNPVGRVWTKEELDEVFRICHENNIVILSDEIHWDLILQGEHTSFGTYGKEGAKNLIICSAPTKTFNLAGTLLAYTIIYDEKLRELFRRRLTEAAHFEAISVFGYEATIAAYEEGEPWLCELLQYLKGNAELFSEWLKRNAPELTSFPVEGTYLVWVDCRKVTPDVATWREKLRSEGIFFTEGIYFGEQGDGFVRINLALPRKELQRILKHWEACMKLT